MVAFAGRALLTIWGFGIQSPVATRGFPRWCFGRGSSKPMTDVVPWPKQYAALISQLPDFVERSGLIVGGFSTCVDIYLSLHDAINALAPAVHESRESKNLLDELKRRALDGIGGEIFIDWPQGADWIDRHIAGQRAIGGTNAQAAYMLAVLGGKALIALADRTAPQLSVLHPDSLLATKDGFSPVSSVPPNGAGGAPHYIFEYTAGTIIDGATVPRSTRTIVRFEHNALHRDPEFVEATVNHTDEIGAGVLCGFNEVPPQIWEEELDYAAAVGAAWREAGLPVIHVELADFPNPDLRDATMERVVPVANSLGMSLSELDDLATGSVSQEAAALDLAKLHGLDRICVHADEWAFTVTRGEPERECEALMAGCLLASTRAEAGYFTVPTRLPQAAQFKAPPLPRKQYRDGWWLVCCPAPYLAKPAATIGLGDTFLAGTLLVLGGAPAKAPPRAHTGLHGGVTAPT